MSVWQLSMMAGAIWLRAMSSRFCVAKTIETLFLRMTLSHSRIFDENRGLSRKTQHSSSTMIVGRPVQFCSSRWKMYCSVGMTALRFCMSSSISKTCQFPYVRESCSLSNRRPYAPPSGFETEAVVKIFSASRRRSSCSMRQRPVIVRSLSGAVASLLSADQTSALSLGVMAGMPSCKRICKIHSIAQLRSFSRSMCASGWKEMLSSSSLPRS